MLITEHVNIPDELIEAQTEGRLVVFAGAGVSKDADLPDFKGLCDDVAKHFRVKRLVLGKDENKKDILERAESFLGRVEDTKCDLNSYLRKEFGKPGLQPTKLHLLLLQLCSTSRNIRLVTTNWDRLFSAAAENLEIETNRYAAPTLPPGDRFRGIVHLHGSVEDEDSELVATDKDFGQAYLTEGWARRFLLTLFRSEEKLAVLVHGYSYGDVILEYLTRALPPNVALYRFSKESERAKWESLGVTPIIYPITNVNDERAEVTNALTQWIEESQREMLDHSHRIKQLVSAVPPLKRNDSDYILRCLTNVPTVRLFAHNATKVEWLSWVNETKVIEGLFSINSTLTDTERILAEWVARNFVVQHSDEVFNIILSHGQRINDDFWMFIAWQLAKGELKPEEKVMAKWVHFLLRRVPAQEEWRNSFNSLLRTCTRVKATGPALAVLDYLLTPVARLEAKLGFLDEGKGKVKHVVGLHGDRYWVKEVWEEYFSEHLDVFWMTLKPILQKHLVAANRMNQDFGHANEQWDSHSFNRSAIAPHEQDRLDYEMDRLINPARDLLDYVFVANPEAGRRIALTWYATGVPLLKRIAIHSVAHAERIDPEEKIGWLLDSDALDYSVYKHESYQLFKSAFPHVAVETQKRVIERALEGYRPLDDEDNAEIRSDEVYNALYWLHTEAPESRIAKEAFSKYQEEHPLWKPREHPDHGTWIGSSVAVTPQSPMSAAQLVADPPEKHLVLFLTLERKSHWDEPGRDGLMGELGKAAIQSFEWSHQLAELLIREAQWKEDIWWRIVNGWKNAEHSETEWHQILAILGKVSSLYQSTVPIGSLLEEGAKRDEGGLTVKLLPDAEALADEYWKSLKVLLRDGEDEMGWLPEAINHNAGNVAEFWIRALWKHQKNAAETWSCIPDDYKDRLDKILGDTSYAAQLARCVFASRVHFFFAIDHQWTREKLVPLFDFDRDNRDAEQAWHGFLFWGAVPHPLIDDFRPLFEKAAIHLQLGRKSHRHRLLDHAVGVAWLKIADKETRDWFYRIMKTISPDERVTVARHIHAQLHSMKAEVKTTLWDEWLGPYWSDRNQGNPVNLSTEEADQFIEWLTDLEPVFSEAVKLALGTTEFELHECLLYYSLAESELPKTYPGDVNRLLVHLLGGSREDFLHCDYVNQIYNTLRETLSVSANT